MKLNNVYPVFSNPEHKLTVLDELIARLSLIPGKLISVARLAL